MDAICVRNLSNKKNNAKKTTNPPPQSIKWSSGRLKDQFDKNTFPWFFSKLFTIAILFLSSCGKLVLEKQSVSLVCWKTPAHFQIVILIPTAANKPPSLPFRIHCPSLTSSSSCRFFFFFILRLEAEISKPNWVNPATDGPQLASDATKDIHYYLHLTTFLKNETLKLWDSLFQKVKLQGKQRYQNSNSEPLLSKIDHIIGLIRNTILCTPFLINLISKSYFKWFDNESIK